MKEKIKKVCNIKSLSTLLLTIALIVMLFSKANPPREVLALFCTSYGAMISYFFTKKDKESGDK